VAWVGWVVRFGVASEPPGMGVSFLDLSEADRRVLATYLKLLP
jgi:hypothetical protein